MATKRFLARTCACLALASAFACGGDSQPTMPTAPTPEPTLSALAVVPGYIALALPGDTQQLGLRATMSDGSQRDVTSEAQWATIDERVVSISVSGLLRALQTGGTAVYARWRQQVSPLAPVHISRQFGPQNAVTGTVRDSATGAPIVGAAVKVGPAQDFGVFHNALTDGNGYFDVGSGSGPLTLRISKFGYEYGSASVADVTADTRLDLRLIADTGAYIERRIVGQLSATPGAPFRHRISTRPGAVVDAVLEVRSCEYSDIMALDLSSNGMFLDGDSSCTARVRAVVPSGECELRVMGSLHINEFTLVYREPR